MSRSPSTSACRLMLIVMLMIQGVMAWHARVHVLENHVSAGVARHAHGHHHDADGLCGFCAFAQDFSRLVLWQAPVVPMAAAVVQSVAPLPPKPALTSATRPYIARAPPAAS